METYIPHLDMYGSMVASACVAGFLYFFHRSRDRMMEFKFLTREDFRRIESKIDALLNVAMQAPFISERQKGAISPKRLNNEET